MNKENAIQMLDNMLNEDNFGPDNFLYSGVLDESLKKKLSIEFSGIILDFKKLVASGASSEQLLKLLDLSINKFDRESLDTEHAENIAAQFEKIMDCVELESSEDILNNWMYGFDIT
jgi:Domain of unknown function (DUF4844)